MTAEATETAAGVYAVDASTIVVDTTTDGAPSAIGPTFQIEDV